MKNLPDPKSIDLVLYHANCMDGFGARYAAEHLLEDAAEYIACSHGDPPPDVHGKRVAILDFSFKRPVLEKMKAEAEVLVVLDHHKSAEEDLAGLDGCHFDMDRSGAMLAWNYFHPGVSPPALLLYIEDRDLWRFKIPDSHIVSAVISCTPMTFADYHNLAIDLGFTGSDPLDYSAPPGIIAQGRAILTFKDHQTQELLKHASLTKFGGGVEMWIINTPVYQSDVGNLLASQWENEERTSRPCVAMMWRYDHQRRALSVSMRSMQGSHFDCARFCQQFGGGGHFHAAGFEFTDPVKIRWFFQQNGII